MNPRHAALFLVMLGLSRVAAELLGLPTVSAIAGATAAAPAPKVFSVQRGLETYSSRFFIEWSVPEGERAVELTPELVGRIAGPYNRRNIYGAAIAYAPLLVSNPATSALWNSVAASALCGDAPLLAELGIETPGRIGPLRLRIAPLHSTPQSDWPTRLTPTCTR